MRLLLLFLLGGFLAGGIVGHERWSRPLTILGVSLLTGIMFYSTRFL